MTTAIEKTTDLSLEYAPFKADIEIIEKDFETVNAIVITDSKTLKQVHDGRMSLKNKRLAIENKRKALNEDALKWQRDNNAMAKTLTAFFEAKEEILQLKQDAYTQEQERIKQAEIQKEQEQLNSRINSLSKYGAAHDVIELKTMPDEAFEALLLQHKSSWESEQQRIAEEKEAQARQQEQQRLESIRLAEERKKLDQEKALIEVEKKKIIQQEAEKERKRLLEKYEREELVKKKRAAQLAPDKEKFLIYIESLLAVRCTPPHHSDAKTLLIQFERLLKQTCEGLAKEVNNL